MGTQAAPASERRRMHSHREPAETNWTLMNKMNNNNNKKWNIRHGERREKEGESFEQFYSTLKAWSKVGMKCETSPGHRKSACSVSLAGDKTEKAGTIQITPDDYFNLCMPGKHSKEPHHLCSSHSQCFLCFLLSRAKFNTSFYHCSSPLFMHNSQSFNVTTKTFKGPRNTVIFPQYSCAWWYCLCHSMPEIILSRMRTCLGSKSYDGGCSQMPTERWGLKAGKGSGPKDSRTFNEEGYL